MPVARLPFGLLILLLAHSLRAGTFTFESDDLIYERLHEGSESSEAALRCYKRIEDENTESGKALSVRLNRRLIQSDPFPVLVTPPAPGLSVGTYRVTVRMGVRGMLNSLGSAVAIEVGGQTREVYLNELDDEDVYQEFALDFEIREGDIVTKANAYRAGVPRRLTTDPELAQRLVKETAEANQLPWSARFARHAVGRALARQLKLKPEDVPRYEGLVREAIKESDGRELRFDQDADAPELSEQAVAAVNNLGKSPTAVRVSLVFPQNSTSRVRGTRGASTPYPTLRRLFVDRVKIEKLPEPDHLVVRDIRPRYPWRRPGEEQAFSVWMHNRSGKAQTALLRIRLENGLDGQQTLLTKDVTLRHGGYERTEWAWQIPKNQRLWGQAAVAEIVRDGKVLSSGRSWFAIHPYSNAVMIHNRGNTGRFRDPYASPPAMQNHHEFFGACCTIHDSAGVVPDPENFFDLYVMGNGSGWMSIPRLTLLTNGMLQQGIAPFFYLESNGSAQRAFEIFWEHPDWVPHVPANTDEFLLKRQQDIINGRKLYRPDGTWRTRDGKPPFVTRAGGAYSGQLVALNGLFRENVDRVIQGTIELCEHAPFAGVRWDGLPFKARNTKALGGTFGKTEAELQKISAANLDRFKREVRAKYPTFEVRANGGLAALQDRQEDPFDFDKAYEIIDRDRHSKELLKDHGSIMEEMWMKYAGLGSYTNNCRNYLRAARFENAAMKHAGGHNGHMLWFYDGYSQYTPDEIYQQVFSFLAGTHLDAAFGPIPESMYDLGVYATRFSEFFWDTNLRPIPEMDEKISVDVEADIWYTEAGFQKVNERGNLLYVIPVINPPVTDIWLRNRFGLLPAPIADPFGMTVRVPSNYQNVVSVNLLDNKPCPLVRALAFEADRGEVYLEVPELIIFKVVTVEFGK